MVRKVPISERDASTLERLRQAQPPVSLAQPESYRDRVVLKPWGHEFLVFENEHVAIWFLHIKEAFATSMHCHPGKRTSLILLAGRAFCNTLNHRIFLDAADAAVFEKGVFHSTKAQSAEGIDLIEVETPPQKTDLVRLNDGYGRQTMGYEGLSEMRGSDLGRFGHFWLPEPAAAAEAAHGAAGWRIRVEAFRDTADFRGRFRAEAGRIYCPCRGGLAGRDGTALEIGEAKAADDLPAPPECGLPGPLTLLSAWREAT